MRLHHIGVAVMLAVCLMLASCGSRPPADVVVEPFYNYNGCKIAVGKFSNGLASKDKAAFLKVIAAMKEEWSELTPEAMYVAAIRLYEFRQKDESVYWFYSAQYRARLIQGLLDPQKLNAVGNPATVLVEAHEAFLKQAGKFINGYAFGNIEKLLKTVARVQAEGTRLPMVKQLYPNIGFIEESRWQKVNYELSTGFSEFMESIRENADHIRAQRKATYTDGTF